jgi:putative sigma-54 modulation protein
LNLSIVGRHVDLSDSIKETVESGVAILQKFELNIISIRVILSDGDKKSFSAEFAINIAQKNSIVVKSTGKDLYSAIDSAIKKAEKTLRREHDKIKDHRKDSISESTFKLISEKEDNEVIEDEIIPQEPKIDKPMEIAQALEHLKDSKDKFFVFYDFDERLRTVYKIEENKYGLY